MQSYFRESKKIQESDKNLQEEDKEDFWKQYVNYYSDGVINKTFEKDIGNILLNVQETILKNLLSLYYMIVKKRLKPKILWMRNYDLLTTLKIKILKIYILL